MNDILQMTLETIGSTFISTILAYIIGLPIGILLQITGKNQICENKVINFILTTFVNILRSIPCLIIIVLMIPYSRSIFGRGTGEWYTILIPLMVCAFGFVSRMVQQSLAEVEAGKVEAIKSLGASNWQLICKVYLPESRSSLISGFAVVCVSILGYTSFAYNIGAGGLISGIYTYYTRHTGDYLSSGYFWLLIAITILIVQAIAELGLYISKKLDKRRVLK